MFWFICFGSTTKIMASISFMSSVPNHSLYFNFICWWISFASCIKKTNFKSLYINRLFNYISCCTSYGTDNCTFHIDQTIKKTRFSCIYFTYQSNFCTINFSFGILPWNTVLTNLFDHWMHFFYQFWIIDVLQFITRIIQPSLFSTNIHNSFCIWPMNWSIFPSVPFCAIFTLTMTEWIKHPMILLGEVITFIKLFGKLPLTAGLAPLFIHCCITCSIITGFQAEFLQCLLLYRMWFLKDNTRVNNSFWLKCTVCCFSMFHCFDIKSCIIWFDSSPLIRTEPPLCPMGVDKLLLYQNNLSFLFCYSSEDFVSSFAMILFLDQSGISIQFQSQRLDKYVFFRFLLNHWSFL